MRFSSETLQSCENILKMAGAIATSAMVCKTISDAVIPDSVADYFRLRLQNFYSYLSNQVTILIEDFDVLDSNSIFDAANLYLGVKLSSTTEKIKVKKPEKEREFTVTVHIDQPMVDYYKGAKLKWVLKTSRIQNNKNEKTSFSKSELRYFELSFHKKYREMVLNSYISYILQQANQIREEKKALKLHTVDYSGTNYWGSIKFDHPATFDTLAMDSGMKAGLIDDLDRFTAGKEYYNRVGKAWKRGYLLYGPSGTGKSSLVAAMANHLNFDIYDLDLNEVQCNSDLRRLLIGTSSRSILVIEDVVNPPESVDKGVTLSGLLNFMDGLWSSSGDERIVVLTTNYKDQIDPVLLRPGRMDVHLHMSYCSFNGFKTLASNYLNIQEHYLFESIEELLQKVQATPAEVSCELMKSADAEVSLQGLISFLQNKAAPVI